MAGGLTIKITGDSSSAQAAFDALASSSSVLADKMDKANKKFADASIDKFIDNQKLAQAAVTATRGSTDAIASSVKAYQSKIESLIKSGLAPQSEQVKKLQAEQQKLQDSMKDEKGFSSFVSNLSKVVPLSLNVADVVRFAGDAVKAAAAAVAECITAYNDYAQANARLDAVLQSTGAAAWTTSGQLQNMASELSSATGHSSNDIKKMQAVLLGFTSVTGDVFKEAQSGLINMAAVMGGDLTSSANTFGKALDNPIEGISSLSRYGFKFTETQKEMIKNFELAGEHAKAQQVILDSMNSAFGDAAVKVNEVTKAQNDYKSAVEAFKIAAGENFAKAVAPITQFFANVINGAANNINTINEYNDAFKAIGNKTTVNGLEEIDARIKIINMNLRLEKGMWSDNYDEQQKYIAGLEKELKDLEKRKKTLEEDAAVKQTAAAEAAANAATEEANLKKISDLRQAYISTREYEMALEKTGVETIKTRDSNIQAALKKEIEGLTKLKLEYKDNEMMTQAINDALKEQTTLYAAMAVAEGNAAQGAARQNQVDLATKYIEKLEEIKLKNDEIENDERQLLELQLQRELASINAAKATTAEKDAGIAAVTELYNEQMRLADIDFYGKQAEKAWAAASSEKASLGERRQNIADFLNEEFDALQVSEEKKVELHQAALDALKKIDKAEHDQRMMNIESVLGSTMDMISTMQSLTDTWAQEEQQKAAERAQAARDAINNQYAEDVTSRQNAHLEEIAERQMSADEALAIQTKLNDDLLKLEQDKNARLAEEDKKAKSAGVQAAQAGKLLASAVAVIDTYQAAAKIMANQAGLGPIAMAASMAATVGMGLANVAKINSTPIPSAETGGRFIVPPSSGVDNTIMRVNPGETVDVTPRSATSSSGQTRFIFQVDKRVLYDMVNEGITSGDILFTTDNL